MGAGRLARRVNQKEGFHDSKSVDDDQDPCDSCRKRGRIGGKGRSGGTGRKGHGQVQKEDVERPQNDGSHERAIEGVGNGVNIVG